MPNAKIDLSFVSIIDHHAHLLVKLDAPMPMERYQGYFSESPDPIIKARYVPDSIMSSQETEAFSYIVVGVILMLVVIFRPQGILGNKRELQFNV